MLFQIVVGNFLRICDLAQTLSIIFRKGSHGITVYLLSHLL